MAEKLVWGQAWYGRSYELGKMTLPELWSAYFTYPAINLYAFLVLISGSYATFSAKNWADIVLPVAAVFIVYPFVWYGLHRFTLHGRWLFRMRRSAALWDRIHFDRHQDLHKLEVLIGSPANIIPTRLAITAPIGRRLVSGWSGAASAFFGALTTTCIYEFFHCIQHLNCKPKSLFVQALKREHLLHHLHNEATNMDIVSFFSDKIFHSYSKTAKDCPKSPTVFNFGYDLEEAKRHLTVMELTGAPLRDKPPIASQTKQEQAG